MASINEKLNYINETKSLIKDKLNDLGSEIEDETTFREYAEKIENLYEELPKVNSEDTNITLNNTKKGKMILILKSNELSQEDTPTPTNPQDIHTITGDNTLKIEGVNLLNRATCTENRALVWADGTTYSQTNSIASDYIKINAGNKVKINYNSQIMFYDSSKTYLGCLYSDGTSLKKYTGIETNSFTVPSGYNIAYMRLGFRTGANNNENMTAVNIMVNKGEILLPYEPYSQNTYPLTLGTLEYSKKGNYKDEFIYNTTDTNLELNKWYLKKNIKRTDNAENLIISTGIGGDGLRYALISKTNLGIISGSQIAGVMLCNKFKEQTISSSRQVGEFLTNTNNTSVQFMVDEQYDTIQKIQQAYPNITCYGAGGTPTYIQLNDTLQTQLTNIYNNMMSKKGQTNISQVNDDLPFIINATALIKNSD